MRMTRGAGEDMAEINITPMIDVLLVLLILFLVIQPGLRRGIDLQLPVEVATTPAAPADQIVLRVSPGPEYDLNGEWVAPEDLGARLEALFASRTRKVLFLDGRDGIRYRDLMHAADLARGGGVEVLGLVPGEPPNPAAAE